MQIEASCGLNARAAAVRFVRAVVRVLAVVLADPSTGSTDVGDVDEQRFISLQIQHHYSPMQHVERQQSADERASHHSSRTCRVFAFPCAGGAGTVVVVSW